MAISTIRHCKLPLKGRASPTTPTLPNARLIRWGRAGKGLMEERETGKKAGTRRGGRRDEGGSKGEGLKKKVFG